MDIKIVTDGQMPYYASEGAAGIDLIANHSAKIKPFERVLINTGIKIEIPSCDYVGIVAPRSGLAFKYGITLINCMGVIDSDYRGEIKCPLINLSDREYQVNKGDRIAQLLIMPVCVVNIIPCDCLSKTVRLEDGFGSTGK